MAKYDIMYKCGHTVKTELFGKETDRQRIIQNANSMLCSECHKLQQVDETKKVEESLNLPSLTGTEKQITWAQTIRAKFFTELNNLIAVKGMPDHPAFKLAYERLNNSIDASFWIDNKNETLQSLMHNLSK